MSRNGDVEECSRGVEAEAVHVIMCLVVLIATQLRSWFATARSKVKRFSTTEKNIDMEKNGAPYARNEAKACSLFTVHRAINACTRWTDLL